MIYYIIKIEEHVDETATGKAIYEYTDKDSCIAAFHTTIGNSMKLTNTKQITVLAIDNDGTVYKNETWVRPTEEE